MRSMFVSRSAFEKPRPFERCSRTSSPSSHSTSSPRRSSSGRTSSAIVVLPAPDKPVNQRVKPLRPFSVIALLDQWGVDVNAAFELLGAGPPAGPLAPLDAAGAGPGRRLLPADAGDPGVVAGERPLERLDLPDVAALVRLRLPEPVRRGFPPQRREPQPLA